MPEVGIWTREDRGCRGYDPWQHLDWQPKTVDRKLKDKLWKQYLQATQELRTSMEHGTITPEQFKEATNHLLRGYADEMYLLTGRRIRW